MPEFSIKSGTTIFNVVIAESLESAEALFGEGNVVEGNIPIRSEWDEDTQEWIAPVPLADLEALVVEEVTEEPLPDPDLITPPAE